MSGDRPLNKRILSGVGRVLGVVVVIAACIFVVDRIVSAPVWAVVKAGRDGLALSVAAGAVAYALSAFLLAAGWLVLLRACGAGDVPVGPGISIYGRSQLAKYIPGNVFHFVGRHVMGRRQGFGHGEMLWAAFLEVVGLILAAGALALPGALFWLGPDAARFLWAIVVAAGFLLAAPWALSRVLPRLAAARGLAVHVLTARDVLRRIMPAYLLYLAFFIVSGCIAWGIAAALDEIPLSALPLLVVAVAVAWIAGFVVPGAAAGIGVREAALIATLSGVLGDANAAVVALAFRAVTLGGDVLFFASSFAFAPRVNRGEA